MYKRLSHTLLKSRTTLLAACKEHDVDPELVDVEQLSVWSCDNCSFWDSHKNMTEELDGSRYCKACLDIEHMRF